MNDYIEVDPEHLRRAQLCQAKNDVRYYLNGVALLAGGAVVGTNGHVLYRGAGSQPLLSTIVIQIKGAVPKAKRSYEEWTAKIRATSQYKGFIEFIADGAITAMLPFDLVDASNFPDIERIVARHAEDADKKPVAAVGVNPSYLAMAGKVFLNAVRFRGVKLDFAGADEVVKITCAGDADDGRDAGLYLMPMRL